MRPISLVVTFVFVAAGCREKPGDGPPPDAAIQTTPGAIEEVLANIRAQPVGDHELADHALPEPFLRRIADRIIRDSFVDRFYTVYDDGAPGGYPPMPPPRDAARGAELVAVLAADRAPELVSRRREQVEARPPRRGYRPDEAWDASTSAAAIVGTRLARDGLLLTLARVLEGGETNDAEFLDRLRAAGFPVDLLDHFALAADRPPGPAIDVVRHVARRLEGRTAASLTEELAALPFVFTPTHAGFHVSNESGEHPIGMMRLQLTRGGYWRAPGEGGSVDVLEQLLTRLPDVSFIASIETPFADELIPLAGAWPLGAAGRLTIIMEPLTVAQWAQDNGKAGVVSPSRKWATIVPRYASRRDDGSLFVPGEASLVDGLAAAGQVIVRSPLLFQGGNLLAVRHPVTAERFLLIGEAEIHRNTALGLTPEQVEGAFRAEFAVDRTVVLPSVSFHIDYDVSVRAVGDDLVAFVNDPESAARRVLACGLGAMQTHDLLPADTATLAGEHLTAGRHRDLAQLLGNTLAANRDRAGRFPLSLARVFAVDAADSPVGNLERFLVSLDILMCESMSEGEQAGASPARTYLESLRRIDRRRLELHEKLRGLGWKVVLVPGLTAGGRSINYVNGIHDRTRYLMPAYGGRYATIDVAAAAVFSEHLGSDVEVIPILCAESQSRSGAVHCSAAAYPAR